MRTLTAFFAAMALCVVASASAEEAFVPNEPKTRASFPGIPIASDYAQVKRWVPSIGACRAPWGDRTCEFWDTRGYHNNIHQDLLNARTAVRARAPWLPFGVAWSDTEDAVVRKLNAEGLEPVRLDSDNGGRTVSPKGMFYEPRTDAGYWMEFYFSPSGQLAEVKQGILWP